MNDRSRPKAAPETPAKKSTASITAASADAALFTTNEHGALIAADAAQGWKRHVVEAAVCDAAARGETFGIDDIERDCGVPCDGNWVGGVLMRLHRSGVLKKAGYRPSTKRSRAGSIVTLWTAGDAK